MLSVEQIKSQNVLEVCIQWLEHVLDQSEFLAEQGVKISDLVTGIWFTNLTEDYKKKIYDLVFDHLPNEDVKTVYRHFFPKQQEITAQVNSATVFCVECGCRYRQLDTRGYSCLECINKNLPPPSEFSEGTSSDNEFEFKKIGSLFWKKKYLRHLNYKNFSKFYPRHSFCANCGHAYKNSRTEVPYCYPCVKYYRKFGRKRPVKKEKTDSFSEESDSGKYSEYEAKMVYCMDCGRMFKQMNKDWRWCSPCVGKWKESKKSESIIRAE